MMVRRAIAAAICGATILATAGQATAQTVKMAGIDLPAECALVKNERPRLLFRGRDLAKFKERIAGPVKDDFERFRDYWSGKIAEPRYDWKSTEDLDGICLGVLYQLTGEAKYAVAVRRSTAFKAGSQMWGHAFVTDLIFDTLSREEIQAQVERLLKNPADRTSVRVRSSYCLWPAIVLHGADSGRDEEIAALIAKGAKEARDAIAHANEWAMNRGGDVNSFSYVGNHTAIHLPARITALANALGEDTWAGCSWTRNIGSYYVYHYFPWRRATIHLDNTGGTSIGPLGTDFGGACLLAAAPARYQDGLYRWWMERIMYDETVRKTRNDAMRCLWGKILFDDPTIPMLEPKEFPPSRFFLTRGLASMRESWDKDATFVHFRCGQFGDLGDGRHSLDQNTFTIYKKGILALDTGAAHALDCMRLKFDPPKDGPNYEYSAQTIAHNGVLVYHADANPHQGAGGGQLLVRNWPTAEWSRMRGTPVSAKTAGKILAWETSPEYDYVAGDATNSYNPVAVGFFSRQLVYVRPNLVFIFDRVETARDGCKTTWLLHTADKPKIDGAEKPDARIHPEGHFLWEGSTVTVTDEEMGGRMFVKMLLPEKREIRLLGGENHEFEVPPGRNCGPTPETYKLDPTSRAVRQSRELGEGLRGWRIEVEDMSGGRSLRFLNVFQTCDKGTARMVPCVPVERDDMVGARVESAGVVVEVLFSREGAVAGKITVEKNGRRLVDRALAAGVEDHYERWKDALDYQKWMTDPFRRSVVLGKD